MDTPLQMHKTVGVGLQTQHAQSPGYELPNLLQHAQCWHCGKHETSKTHYCACHQLALMPHSAYAVDCNCGPQLMYTTHVHNSRTQLMYTAHVHSEMAFP
jgi:hypothetical protein